jgi:hypothetical protein
MVAFTAMRGAEILEYVRDAVIQTVVDKRSFLEQSAAIGGNAPTKAELAEARALEAAADVIQYAISAGQEAQTKGRDAPDFVMRMAAQARTALTASED